MAEERVQRRLTVILAADVVSYSRLMGDDEEATLATLKSYRGVIDELIQDYDGRVFGSAGDSVIAEFASPVDAVRCAADIQTALDKANADVPEDRRMRLRIGVHLGDVMVDGDNLFGNGVNVAARLEGLAEPGGICVSGTVYDQVDGRLDHSFESLGTRTVKNIAKPVRAYRVLFGGARMQTRRDTLPHDVSDKASIAVLPFNNLSGDPEQELFSNGLAESLITTLTKAPGLLVIAHSSSIVYAEKSADAQQVARDLSVSFVLQGSIQRLGNRMRINAQLIDGADGRHVWAERYDRVVDDFFLLQDDITLNILTACQVQLTEGEAANMWLARKGSPNLPAIELHWEALTKFRKFNGADNAAARALWERAVALGATDATLLAYIAYTHAMDANANWSEDREASLVTAGEIAAEAESLDGRNFTVKLLQATIAQLHQDHEQAVRLARQAVEIQPGSADSQYVLGIHLYYAGHPEQAARAIGTAMRLSPFYPTGYLYQLGVCKFLLGRHDEAIDIFDRCRHRNPGSRSNYVWMATVHAAMGDRELARACARRAMELDPDITIARWMTTEPYKDREVVKRITSAMRSAGFREE